MFSNMLEKIQRYILANKCLSEILTKNETIHAKCKIMRYKVLISQIYFSICSKITNSILIHQYHKKFLLYGINFIFCCHEQKW